MMINIVSDSKTEAAASTGREASDMSDLLARLHGAQNTYIKLSELALKSKKVKEAKQFDIYAVAIFEAVAILENTEC